jgi:ADP-dependent NAD(P)H-hydrate dehydratase / NAD(P)H-hydrate epimerase
MAILVLGSAAMREVDRKTIQDIGIPGAVLMETAGRACAEAVQERLPKNSVGKVGVLCGKGNNGGDGLVAARYLINAGHRVDVYLLTKAEQLQGDAAQNYRILERLGFPVHEINQAAALKSLDLSGCDVLLDAIFGTGLSTEVRGLMAEAIRAINAASVPVVSVDIPSGVSCDSGAVLGVAVKANHTVTFGYPKCGHLLYPGASLCGDLSVADIGFPPDLAPQGPGQAWLLTDQDIAAHVSRREPDAHKGRFGHLLVVAGSTDKPGAAGLCCHAAMRSGAGLVTLAARPEVLNRVVSGPVEFMGAPIENYAQLQSLCQDKQAVVLGPGLGTDPVTAQWVRKAVAELGLPMVVDADGLNLLSEHLDLLRQAPAKRILTPHPGEMARLLQITTAEVQRDRMGCARGLASSHGCVVVLKGAGTLVAQPDQTIHFSLPGNPGMASGGTGDVLTGIIGALLCQGLDAAWAGAVGAYVHGQAGDEAAQVRGQHSLIASDLIEFLPQAFRRFEAWGDLQDNSEST